MAVTLPTFGMPTMPVRRASDTVDMRLQWQSSCDTTQSDAQTSKKDSTPACRVLMLVRAQQPAWTAPASRRLRCCPSDGCGMERREGSSRAQGQVERSSS